MKLIESFLWGIPAALGALFMQIGIVAVLSILNGPTGTIEPEMLMQTPQGLLVFVLLEEIFKYIVIAKRIDSISLNMSYFSNSLVFGIGFAITEQFIRYSAFGPIGTGDAILILGAASVHLITSQMIGYRISSTNPMKAAVIVPTIALATGFHFLYNFLLLLLEYSTLSIAYGALVILAAYTLVNVYRFKKQS